MNEDAVAWHYVAHLARALRLNNCTCKHTGWNAGTLFLLISMWAPLDLVQPCLLSAAERSQ